VSAKPIRFGYCLSLTGPLASNGNTARLAHQLWERHVNRNGGLLGRLVEMVCIDDETNPKLVPGIYKRLLDDKSVDLVIGGYGDNSVSPAMPLIIERNRFFIALMALAVNASLSYPNYFVMIPTGPHPIEALTEGFLTGRFSTERRGVGGLACAAIFFFIVTSLYRIKPEPPSARGAVLPEDAHASDTPLARHPHCN